MKGFWLILFIFLSCGQQAKKIDSSALLDASQDFSLCGTLHSYTEPVLYAGAGFAYLIDDQNQRVNLEKTSSTSKQLIDLIQSLKEPRQGCVYGPQAVSQGYEGNFFFVHSVEFSEAQE